MFIRSERLFLRPAWPEDWAELLSAISDESVVCNLAAAPWPYTVQDAISYVRRPQQKMLPHFLVTLPGGDGAKLIGSVGLGRRGDDVEIGYWIARGHWNQGYATEAVRAVLRLAAALGHRRIVAGHFKDNPACGRVLEKAGFERSTDASLRFSEARRTLAPTQTYTIALGADCTRDDNRVMDAA